MSILKKEVCQNVDNAVVWFVGRGSLARKQFALCITPSTKNRYTISL